MIVAEQKPLPEIRQMISPYKRILILGCGTCMTVCDAGGEREVTFMDNALRLMQSKDCIDMHEFAEFTVKRQCDPEFMDILQDKVKDYDAILSMGCGIGVQTVAEKFNIPVLPGLNTLFMGASQQQGVWDERCAACGDCRLDDTAGICPVTRCTKGILNGPCAGVKKGKCEANKEMDCAWVLIYERLEKTGQLGRIRRDYPMRNFRAIPRPRRLIKTSAGGASNG